MKHQKKKRVITRRTNKVLEMSNRTVWSSLEHELVGLFATWLWRVRRRAKAKEAKEMAQSGKGLQV